MSTRSAILAAHRWVGVALALFLALQGLSGAALAFRDVGNLLLHGPALRVVPAGEPLPVSALLDAVRAAHPGARVARVEYPAGPGRAFLFRLADGRGARYASVDPYSGAVLRSAPLYAWPVELLAQWHDNMLLGGPGANAVGLLGLGLLAMAATGPVLWWPGARRLGSAFTVRLGSGSYRAVLDLHRVPGAVLAAVLLLGALTGIAMAWRGPVLAALGTVLPTAPSPAPTVPPGDGPVMGLDAVVALVRQDAGGLPVRNLRLLGPGGTLVHVYLEDGGAGPPGAARQAWADARTGAILARAGGPGTPAGDALLEWMLPVHSGVVAGTAGRLLVAVAGLGLAMLSITGLWVWTRKRGFRRQQLAKRKAPAKAA